MPAFPADGHGRKPGSPAGTGEEHHTDHMERSPTDGAPPDAAASRFPADGSTQCCMALPFGLVALAAGKHPFPSRTRPLRLHAVMILRPGARESNASPILISSGPWLPAKPGDFFVSLFPPRLARRRKTPAIGTEVLRAEARDVPTTYLPTSPPLGRKFSARERGMYRLRPR